MIKGPGLSSSNKLPTAQSKAKLFVGQHAPVAPSTTLNVAPNVGPIETNYSELPFAAQVETAGILTCSGFDPLI